MNTWQQGSAVDLRRNDKTGSQLVTYRTRSSIPELKDCGRSKNVKTYCKVLTR